MLRQNLNIKEGVVKLSFSNMLFQIGGKEATVFRPDTDNKNRGTSR